MEFLRYGRAAHDRATFDDSHLQTGAGEVSSTGEAIVARSDDHYVTLIHHRSEMWFRFREITLKPTISSKRLPGRVMDEDQDSAFPACNSAVPACNCAVGVPAVSRSTDHSQTDLAVVWRVGKRLEHVLVFFPVPTSARLCVRACADTVGNHRAASLHPRQLACLESCQSSGDRIAGVEERRR